MSAVIGLDARYFSKSCVLVKTFDCECGELEHFFVYNSRIAWTGSKALLKRLNTSVLLHLWNASMSMIAYGSLKAEARQNSRSQIKQWVNSPASKCASGDCCATAGKIYITRLGRSPPRSTSHERLNIIIHCVFYQYQISLRHIYTRVFLPAKIRPVHDSRRIHTREYLI